MKPTNELPDSKNQLIVITDKEIEVVKLLSASLIYHFSNNH